MSKFYVILMLLCTVMLLPSCSDSQCYTSDEIVQKDSLITELRLKLDKCGSSNTVWPIYTEIVYLKEQQDSIIYEMLINHTSQNNKQLLEVQRTEWLKFYADYSKTCLDYCMTFDREDPWNEIYALIMRESILNRHIEMLKNIGESPGIYYQP